MNRENIRRARGSNDSIYVNDNTSGLRVSMLLVHFPCFRSLFFSFLFFFLIIYNHPRTGAATKEAPFGTSFYSRK